MSELTKVFEKLEAWRASPKLGQLGQVDEVHGWRNPVELREHEVDELLTLRTLRDAGDEEVERLFPLQTSRQAAPGPRQIPWSIAEIAYGEYSRRYGKGQSLERLAERGGFGWCEMDMYYPDWRKDVSEIESLRQQLREAREEIERLKGDADRYRWLRSHSWHEPYHIFFGPGCNQLEPHHLDQAIDNEMKYPIIEGDQT